MQTSEDARHTPPKPPSTTLVGNRSMRPRAYSTGLVGASQLSKVRSSEIGPAEGLLVSASVRTQAPRESESDPEADFEKGSGKESESVLEEDEGPPDGGLEAWSVVLGCFILAGCQMGYGTCWGVLMQELRTTRFSDVPLSTLSLVAGVCNFLAAAGSLVGGRLGDRFGYKRMLVVNIGATYLSLIIASFVPSLALLFIFQGACLGLSFAIGLPIFMSFPSQWFAKRRGFATGVAVSGSGIGGGISSLIIRGLLPRLGYRHTLLTYASINFVASCVAWTLLKVRVPPSRQAGQRSVGKNWLPVGIWRDGAFYSLMLSILIGCFGFLTPLYYITAYTVKMCPELDPTSLAPAIPLVLSGFAMGFGRICAGLLADEIGPVNSISLSFFLGGMFQVCVWPYAKTYGSIIAFGILSSFSGAWFLSLLPVATAQLFGLSGLATITGMGVLANSPGQFVGAVIGGIVLEQTGGNYRAVAYYSGSMMLGGKDIKTLE